MPKQIWKIDKFEGGINDKADARDILDSQFVQADGIEVNNVGKIVIGGGKTPALETVSGDEPANIDGGSGGITFSHGYGLFKFGTDYSLAASQVPAVAETKYLVFFDDTDNLLRGLQSTSSTLHEAMVGDWLDFNGSAILDDASDGVNKVVGYFADGAFRISDANFANANDENKWIGVVKKTLFNATTVYNGSSDAVVSINKWITTSQKPTPPLNTLFTTSIDVNHSNSDNADRGKGTWHVTDPMTYFYIDGKSGFNGSSGLDVSTNVPQNAHICSFAFHDPNDTTYPGNVYDIIPTLVDDISSIPDDPDYDNNGDYTQGQWNSFNSNWGSDHTASDLSGDHSSDYRMHYNDYEKWFPVYMRIEADSGPVATSTPWQVWSTSSENEHLRLRREDNNTGWRGKGMFKSNINGGFTVPGEGSFGMQIWGGAAGRNQVIRFCYLLEDGIGTGIGSTIHQNNLIGLGSSGNMFFNFDSTKSAYITIKNVFDNIASMTPDVWAGTSTKMLFNSFSIEFINVTQTINQGGGRLRLTESGYTKNFKWVFNPADYFMPVNASKPFILELNASDSIINTPGKVTGIIFEMDVSLIEQAEGWHREIGLGVSDLIIGDSGCAQNENGFSTGNYKFGITNLIDGDSESSVVDKGSNVLSSSKYYGHYQNTAVAAWFDHREASSTTHDTTNLSWEANLANWSADERTKGQNIYIQKTNSDNWFRVGELRFGNSSSDGGGLDGAFGKFTMDTPWKNGNWTDNNQTYVWNNTAASSSGIQSNVMLIKDASLIWDYSALNAFSDLSISLEARFKTATQMNRQVYIGNISQESISYADRMIKSPVNKFDIFPSKGREIDVIVKDGDHITAVEGFADRILQFKKNSINVINCTKDSEFLETTIYNVGVEGPWAVIKTDIGIAFANNRGCYLYDGEKFTNLIEGKIDDSVGGIWDTHATSKSLIGYQQHGRKILVTGGTNNVDVYMFSLQTGGWTKSPGAFTPASASAHNQTNLVTFFDGYIYWVDDDDNKLYTWRDKVAQDITMITKDIDFGHPGVKKKVSKVYVTCSGTAGNVDLTYGVNGGTIDKDFDGSLAAGVTAFTPDDSTESNNIYSIQLKIAGTSVNANFEINDISIVYRLKNIK